MLSRLKLWVGAALAFLALVIAALSGWARSIRAEKDAEHKAEGQNAYIKARQRMDESESYTEHDPRSVAAARDFLRERNPNKR